MKRMIQLWRSTRSNWKAIASYHFQMPINHWARRLVSRALQSWKEFINQSKLEKQLMQEAEGWRKKAIQQDAMAMWLRIGDALKQEKLESVAPYSVLTNQEICKVQKWAYLWRSIVLNRKSEARKHAIGLFETRKLDMMEKPKLLDRGSFQRAAPRKPAFLFPSVDPVMPSNIAPTTTLVSLKPIKVESLPSTLPEIEAELLRYKQLKETQ